MMATSRPYQPSSPYSLQHPSPLEALGRRQNIPQPVRLPPAHSSNSSRLNPQFTYPTQSPSGPSNHLTTPPRQQPQHPGHHLTPSSPLLHSHFSRGSTATRSSKDDNSYLDFSGDSSQGYPDDYYYYDEESIYSSAPAIRDSWESHGTSPHKHLANDYVVDDDDDVYDAYAAGPDSPVPTVFVSPVPDEPIRPAGKTPILRSAVTNNYSRPVRPSLSSEESPAELEGRKRRVLERNGRSPTSSYYSSPASSPSPSQFPAPPDHFQNSRRSPLSQLGSGPRSPSPTDTIHSPVAALSNPYPSPNMLSVHRPEAISLPRKPPSVRADSPESLYSTYSFYQLDNGSSGSSPSSSQFPPGAQSQPNPVPQPTTQPPPPTVPTPKSQADYLQLGITHHEANRLTESASCFEKSATIDGGCGVGMLMWGLTLRHGWGCPKNEKTGFSWLRKAAELALGELEHQQGMSGKEEIKSELVLAIYEVGQCFFHGWGVAKDQKMAVKYYTTAARLGDPDAQSDLAFCLANGKGCKKDRKEAARWYRKAVAQGQSDIGLAWIYKEKFQ